MRAIYFLPFLLLVAGCSQGGPSYLPLTEGHEWSYAVRSGFQNNVDKITVGEKTNVGTFEGRTLKGELGDSKLAWTNTRLLASQFANSRFSPPVCLMDESKIPPKKKPRENEFIEAEKWSGKIESFGKLRGATAVLSQRRTSIQLPSGNTNVVETVLDIQIENTRIEVRTWFERGKGIVRQEQRTNRNLVVSMDLIKSK